jgi:hypothetical protein
MNQSTLNLLLDKEHWATSHPDSPTANTSLIIKKKKQPTQATKLASIGATDLPEPHCKDLMGSKGFYRDKLKK